MSQKRDIGHPNSCDFKICTLSLLLCLTLAGNASAQVNGVGQKPYMGWSSWSQETLKSQGQAWLTEDHILAQSDALKSSGLQSHGYNYVNIDSGWTGSFDSYGRPLPNSAKFPHGIVGTVAHIHKNGQKAGIYWIPGIERPVVDANPLIAGSTRHIREILVRPYTTGNAFGAYHNKIDYSKPGAQEYVNSVVDLFASWGIDFIKLDGMTPGSDKNNLQIDNRQDVKAWSKAIARSGRPMWLTASWALDHNYAAWWEQWTNGHRIEDDVECYCNTLTNWPAVARRFNDVAAWQKDAGPAMGWNDLDSLDVGSGASDGLTKDEKQTTMTLWAMANAPLYVGDDLSRLDAFGLQLLSNDAVIAVDQCGIPAKQLRGGKTAVWAIDLGKGAYYVALFNLNGTAAEAKVEWSSLGFRGKANVVDLWAHTNLGRLSGGYTARLRSHASRLLKVTVERP